MLLYLSGHSTPDIAFAVHQCTQHTFKPTRHHELAFIQIGCYLKGRMDKGLIKTPSPDPCVDCYPDANFAGLYGHKDTQDPHCARRCTGYVILAFSCPILWRSHLQTEITLSTMEAECVALRMACKDLLPLVSLICELSNADDKRHECTSSDSSHKQPQYPRWLIQLRVRLPRSWYKDLPIACIDTEAATCCGLRAHQNILHIWTAFYPPSSL